MHATPMLAVMSWQVIIVDPAGRSFLPSFFFPQIGSYRKN
jgi:hypothetical protein